MKKIIALLVVAFFVLSLVACGGVETPSYPPSNPPEEDLIGKQYQEIKRFLTDVDDNVVDVNVNYSNEYSLYDYENNALLPPIDALAFSYKWLNEHKDYKDSADYLQNFVLLEDTLTKITKQTTDVFGQVSETVSGTYYYDNEGNCFQFSDLYKTFEFVHLSGVAEKDIKDCQYDDDGRLISVELYQKNIVAIGIRITFVYDERGNLTEAAFVHYSGTSWSNTFTYNESNQLMTARYARGREVFDSALGALPPIGYNSLQYEYDAQGRLSKIIIIKTTDSTQILPGSIPMVSAPSLYSEYIYNEDGQIEEIQYSDYKDVYTYDEKGRIAYIEHIPSDTGTAQSYKLIYHYEDVLRYHK